MGGGVEQWRSGGATVGVSLLLLFPFIHPSIHPAVHPCSEEIEDGDDDEDGG